MASLELETVSKTYDARNWAVRDLSLSIEDGEFVVMVGPSGCGKTTALRMLAGFEDVTAGEIRIGGQCVNHVPPRDRDIAMVFQNYALYPHMNVYDNIGYGLRVRGLPKAERKERIERAAAILALTDELKRKPSQLSGGQRQRVAMGRAIVREPRAFLMDEPLSNLDARLRVRMRAEIAKLQRDLGVTTVYVTHDQVEAMTMADRVAVMRGGLLQQLDTPQRVYSDPANLFVASFIGSPAMNLLDAELHQEGTHVECWLGRFVVPIPDRVLVDQPSLARATGRKLVVGIRPDAVSIAPTGPEGLQGVVAMSEQLGSEVIAHVGVEGVRSHVAEGDSAELPETGFVADGAPVASTVLARLAGDAGTRRGDHVSLLLDASRMHFFDPEDGRTLRTESRQLVASGQ